MNSMQFGSKSFFKSAQHNLSQVFITQDDKRHAEVWVSSPQCPPGVPEVRDEAPGDWKQASHEGEGQ